MHAVSARFLILFQVQPGDDMAWAESGCDDSTWSRELMLRDLPGQPECSNSGGGRAAEKLRAAVEAVRVEFEGDELGVTVSIGAALLERKKPS